MAHKSNTEFYLYTGLNATASDGFFALEKLKQSGIPFVHLHYGDPAQLQLTTNNVATWFPTQSITVPFVTYAQHHEIADPAPRIAMLVSGLEAILDTDWQALAAFSG